MQEELQPLLDRIQSEGLAKAKAAAAETIAKAEKEAKDIVAAAEAKAQETIAKAQDEAAKLQSRAEESLRQASRDVLLALKADIDNTFGKMLLAEVSGSLRDPALLARVVEEAVRTAIDAARGGKVEVLVRPEDADAVAKALVASAALRAKGADGFRVEASDEVSAGFRLLLHDGRVEHDFSAEAVRDALSAAIRPALAKIVFAPQD